GPGVGGDGQPRRHAAGPGGRLRRRPHRHADHAPDGHRAGVPAAAAGAGGAVAVRAEPVEHHGGGRRRLGAAVRARGARLGAGGQAHGVHRGRGQPRRRPPAHPVPPRPRQRAGAADRARHRARGGGHHRRGGAVVPRLRRPLGRHLGQHRGHRAALPHQRPLDRHAGRPGHQRHGAGPQPGGRRAARRHGPAPQGRRVAVTPTDRTPWRVQLLIYGLAFLCFYQQSVLFPVLPRFASDLGISVTLVGLVLAARFIVPALFAAQMGEWTARFGLKRSLVWVSVGTVLTTPLYLVADSLALLLLAQVVNGSLYMAAWIASQTYATRVPDRDWVLGVFAAVTAVGLTVGPIVGGLALDHSGYPAAFGAYAAGAALLAVVAWLLGAHPA